MNELDMVGEVNADEPRAGTARLATARERMMATIAEEKVTPVATLGRKHRKVRVASWTTVGVAAAAAAVVVLVGTTQTPAGPHQIPAGPAGPAGPAPVNAAFVLNEAADHAIHQKDQPIHPGQYRYVSEKISTVGTSGGSGNTVAFAWRERDIEVTWVPYDESGLWTKKMGRTGRPVVIADNHAKPINKEAMNDPNPIVWSTGRCGDFFSPDKGTNPCGRPFDHKQLTSAMIKAMPRDPHKLLTDEYLGKDLMTALQRSTLFLRSGLVPGDLRAAIYRALALVPGIEITDNFANLDGRKGVAFGGAEPGYRTDVIIDPATGQYIGFRMVDDGTMGLPKGTVHDSSSLVTGVVDKVGEAPRH